MAEQYFAIYFDDPGTPAFISGSKMYVGTVEEIRVVINRLQGKEGYSDTVQAWKDYLAGNASASHSVAYNSVPLLTPVEVVYSSRLSLGEHSWEHYNVWGFPYHMIFKSAVISQIIIKSENEYIRLFRAWLDDLGYKYDDGTFCPLQDRFWGNDFLLDSSKVPGGHFRLNNLLYMEEDSADNILELATILPEPNRLNFSALCDEIFADG